MKISFEYFAQVRKATGTEKEELDLAEGTELQAALDSAAGKHGADFRSLVLDDSGSLRPSMIVLINGQATKRDEARKLAEGDSIALLSAVAGG
jgi:MoaD family protein